jgi:hypothetical protein
MKREVNLDRRSARGRKKGIVRRGGSGEGDQERGRSRSVTRFQVEGENVFVVLRKHPETKEGKGGERRERESVQLSSHEAQESRFYRRIKTEDLTRSFLTS